MNALRAAALVALAAVAQLGGCAPATTAATRPGATPGAIVARLQREARDLKPLVKTSWVHRFLEATAQLPAIEPRVLYHDAGKEHYFTEAEAARLDPMARRALTKLP